MVDKISQSPSGATNDKGESASPGSEGEAFEQAIVDAIDEVVEQLSDPDGIKFTGGITSKVGEASFNIELNERDGFTGGVDAEFSDETPFGSDSDGTTIGAKSGLGKDGAEIKTEVAGREAVGTLRKANDGSYEITVEVDILKGEKKSSTGRIVGGLPDTVKGALQGPTGWLTDIEPKIVVNQRVTPEGEVTTNGGIKLEASPSKLVETFTPIERLDPKAYVQLEGVFMNDAEFDIADIAPELDIAALPQEQPVDIYGIMSPQTRPGHTWTVDLGMSNSVVVSEKGGLVGSQETVTPEVAAVLEGMAREMTALEYEAKADAAGNDLEAFRYDVSAKAMREGVPVRQASMLGADARTARMTEGDTRNTEALIADSRDNGFIDGSNLPEARIGDETYAISAGGGMMHGRTTMTPSEITARANAHVAHGGEVDGGMVAKARADAMGQSLRDGFSVKDQISVDDRALPAPGDKAAAMRRELEAMVDAENGVALDARERKALDGMIAEVRGIEEAARFEAAKGVADNEYDLAMQMQEQQALDDMIAEANKLEELAEVPIPAFKPSSPGTVRSGDDDGPDMRGDEVAYGRGTVFTDRTGRQHVAFESFSDWGAAIRDSFNGNPARVGVAIPNAREIAEQKAAREPEGGENNGLQGGDVPEAGSKENDTATSAEFDAMGSGSNAGPDKDEADKGDDKASTSGRDDHEPGENNGADIGGSNDANDNYGAPSDGIY